MTTIFQEVLAKSEPPVSLKQHIDECLKVYESLRKAFVRLPIIDTDRFWRVLRLGIIFHDLGKSHTEFQKILIRKHGNWYHQRHELFSVPFINQMVLPEEDILLLKLIVAGHHKDFNFLFDFIQHSYKSGTDMLSFTEDGKLDWDEETGKLNAAFIKSFLNDYGISLSSTTLIPPFSEIKEYCKEPFNTANVYFQELMLASGALKHCDHSASAGIFKVNILEEKHFNFLFDKKWVPYFQIGRAHV